MNLLGQFSASNYTIDQQTEEYKGQQGAGPVSLSEINSDTNQSFMQHFKDVVYRNSFLLNYSN